jgi:GNAT superfamily N-acetyltransferase
MERYTPEAQEETMGEGLYEFIHELSEMTGEQLPVEYIDGTYQIEVENFTLTFTCEDKIFEVRSIDVRGNQGLGHQIVSTIHNYADEYGLEVIASNVQDTARGFWEKMGYQEGEIEDEYFRVA